MACQLCLEHLAEGALQHLDSVPVDAGELQGIDRDVGIGPAAVAASLPAGNRPVPFPLGPLYGYGRASIKDSEAVKEQGKPWIPGLVLGEAQAGRFGYFAFLMGFFSSDVTL